jgi:acylphosphatase
LVRKFIIEGRVQGVWFRESTRRQAIPLGLAGHAINLPDGTVEVLACGASEALDSLQAWLHQGPTYARVDRVTSTSTEDPCLEGFRTG